MATTERTISAHIAYAVAALAGYTRDEVDRLGITSLTFTAEPPGLLRVRCESSAGD